MRVTLLIVWLSLVWAPLTGAADDPVLVGAGDIAECPGLCRFHQCGGHAGENRDGVSGGRAIASVPLREPERRLCRSLPLKPLINYLE